MDHDTHESPSDSQQRWEEIVIALREQLARRIAGIAGMNAEDVADLVGAIGASMELDAMAQTFDERLKALERENAFGG